MTSVALAMPNFQSFPNSRVHGRDEGFGIRVELGGCGQASDNGLDKKGAESGCRASAGGGDVE